MSLKRTKFFIFTISTRYIELCIEHSTPKRASQWFISFCRDFLL
nr:MAG TPA: hypothetical protein [Caudoviricetes sp.]